MAENFGLRELITVLLLMLSSLTGYSEQAQSFEDQTLLRIRELLNSPASLRSWKNDTDFCNTQTSSSVTVICYGGSITQLHIISEKGTPRLPENFSIDALVTSLVKLKSLKVLKLVSLGLWGPLPRKISRLSGLEILDLSSNFFRGEMPREMSLLVNLQTLILDGNKFTGKLPDGLGLLGDLAVLSVKNNSFGGPLPDSIGDLINLRILSLSRNNFKGNVPDLSSLESLQVLDLEENSFGPKFPLVGNKISSLVLRRNSFTSSIPENVQSCHQLQHLDVSSNGLVGPFPSSLLSLPLISYLSIAENKLTGMLFENLPCNPALNFVDLSVNLLTGRLPSCLRGGSKGKVVLYTGNCLETGDKNQHPVSFCRNEALAVGIIPRHHGKKMGSKAILALSICGSVIGGVILLAIVFFIVRSFRARPKTPTRLIMESASTTYTSKLFSDARYITQAMKLGSLGVPSYRTFSLEELEVATNNFDTSTFIGEGSTGQIYRGRLRDGSYVAIRCLKLKRSNSIQNFMHQIELISKLRYQHLASALGHCFECYLDDSSVSRIFLVFEYVPNGTLRSWISDKHTRRRLNWEQRVSAAIGVAKGIQFLHTGIVPGVFSNNLKITDVLLDQNLVAKISSFSLPILDENTGKASLRDFPSSSKELNSARERYNEKMDVYDFGVILLEIITGRRINSKDVKILKEQLQASLTGDDAWRRNVVDPRVKNSSSDESVKTMVEICYRCLLEDPVDRPSVEDVLWNLQFAAQVQDASCRGDSQSSDSSPISPFQPPRQIAIR